MLVDMTLEADPVRNEKVNNPDYAVWMFSTAMYERGYFITNYYGTYLTSEPVNTEEYRACVQSRTPNSEDDEQLFKIIGYPDGTVAFQNLATGLFLKNNLSLERPSSYSDNMEFKWLIAEADSSGLVDTKPYRSSSHTEYSENGGRC